jgi:hypothetical protein
MERKQSEFSGGTPPYTRPRLNIQLRKGLDHGFNDMKPKLAEDSHKLVLMIRTTKLLRDGLKLGGQLGDINPHDINWNMDRILVT